MTTHALLSASGSERWLQCTPSARAEEGKPDRDSIYSREGTFAHSLSQWCLDFEQAPDNTVGMPPEITASEFYTHEMVEHVQAYVDYCNTAITQALSRSPDAVVLIEHRVDYSHLVEEGFGTGDVVIVSDGVLDIIDLKYGKGKFVHVENNSQMRLYALGTLREFGWLYHIDQVRMTVFQPRLDNIGSEILTPQELIAWGETQVRRKAELAWRGEGDFVVGPHCQFCKARFDCRARNEESVILARAYFARPPAQYTLAECAEVLPHLDAWEQWAADLRVHAMAEALAGREVPGYKLVEGRSNRRYSDEAAVATQLAMQGLAEASIYKPRELLPITAMEKSLGKKAFENLLVEPGLIAKPAGKATLVCAADKRTALLPTQYFEDISNG